MLVPAHQVFWLRTRELTCQVAASIMKRKWIWIMGIGSLLVINHWFTLGINASSSLPNLAYLVNKQDHDLHRGDYVSFRWHGGGPYLPGIKFVKKVRGVPGDVVTRQGLDFFINGEYVSTAKTHARTGQPLTPGPTGVIPQGRYYVDADHLDSLDSRYAITGWIKAEAVVGKAQPIF